MHRTSRFASGLCALALVAGACSGDDDTAVDRSGGSPDGDTRTNPSDGEIGFGVDRDPATPKTWTFMVYLVGDTDLEPFALEDISEMAEVGSQDELNIVVLADRASGYTDEGVLDQADWETAKLFDVGQGTLDELADLGELDLGDPDTLGDFVFESARLFPADNYALSVWDHGGGWTGIGPDESADDVLELDELSVGLRRGLDGAGIEKLDLLGFDACLMATYEVVSALAPTTEYFLASQELEPGHGWDYASLQVLADDPTADGADLGRALIVGFDAHAAENQTRSDITLSLVDTAQVPALDDAMESFAARLSDQAAALAPVVGRQRADTLEFGRSENPADSTQLADLGVFVSEIGVQSLQVSDEADAVIRALNDAVIERTAGPARLGATGLSIYFPPNASLYDADYPAASFAGAGSWNDFLSAYHGAGNAIPADQQAAFSDPDVPLEIFDVEGGVDVEAAFDPDTIGNVVDAYLTYGIIDAESGALILLGDDDAIILDDGSGLVVGFSDLTVFNMSDGVDTTPAYLGFTTDEESGLSTVSVPLDYLAPDDDEIVDVEYTLTIDEEGTIIEETFYVVNEAGTWGELVLDPDGLIFPVLPVIDDNGDVTWETLGEGLFADLALLEFTFDPIESGVEVYVELGIEDFGGNVASVAGTFDS